MRLGTRGSALARWQAEWTAARLTELGVSVEMIHITTEGDRNREPISQAGGQGLFTKEIQRALLDDRIDVAVHSLKDLPTDPVARLVLAAVPPRASNRDVLVSNTGATLASLPPNAKVGTGSRRRKSQLLGHRDDLQVDEIRGNVDTRLKKLDDCEYDAIVLAEAGLQRLGLDERITHVLDRNVMLPAVGQGALGIEARESDEQTREILAKLDHMESHAAVLAERSLLSQLQAGCLAPVGAWGRFYGDELKLDAAVFSLDGSRRLASCAVGRIEDSQAVGRAVADDLLSQGAADLILESRAGSNGSAELPK